MNELVKRAFIIIFFISLITTVVLDMIDLQDPSHALFPFVAISFIIFVISVSVMLRNGKIEQAREKEVKHD